MARFRISSDQPQRLVLTRGNSNGAGNIIGLIIFAVVACVGLSSFFDQGGDSNPVTLIVGLIVGLGLLSSVVGSLRSTRVVIDGNLRTAERADTFLFFPMARQQMSLNVLRDVVVATPRNAAQTPASLPVWQVQLQGTDGSTLIVNERGTRGEMQALAEKVGAILNRPVREESKASASLNPGGVTGTLLNLLTNNISALGAPSASSNKPDSLPPILSNIPARLRQDDAERKRAHPPLTPPNTLSQDNAPMDYDAPMVQGNAGSVIPQTFDATFGGLNTPSISYTAPPVLVLPALPGFTSFAPAMDLPALPPLGSPTTMLAGDVAPVQEFKQVEIAEPPPNILSGVASDTKGMNDATTSYRSALQAFAARNFGDALKAFERVLDLDPGNAAANNDLGILYFQQNKLKEAERAFRHTIALDPFSTPGRYNLGLTLYRLGKRGEAMEQFRMGARNAARGEEKYFQNALQGNFQAPLPAAPVERKGMQATVPNISNLMPKSEIVDLFRTHLQAQGFMLAEVDAARPWGAFLRVANDDAGKFIRAYFADVPVPAHAQLGERSPKILLVAPHARLSWQYHDRRGELWRVVRGPVGVFVSETDDQPEDVLQLNEGEMIELAQGTRHRLVGLDNWGAVAEIWIHTDAAHPSDEDDIYRLQDDYERS